MHVNDDAADRPGEGGLTTENLAHPDKERDTAVYPGEATAGWGTGEATGADAGEEEGDTGAQTGEAEAADETGAGATTARDTGAEQDEPLLARDEAERFQTEWSEIQGRFVDEPQEAVRAADTLVAEVMQTLAQTFNSHKQDLEGQWTRGEEVATEELRLALQRYRSFFTRLLKT
ncbi:hypothetical protein ABZ128_25820 [Streptomyces sp. NPDC006326]|uniref:hypothetical protein n=1 Tax=Streptomyces sp. NPDC006326 TaxID=3156752 RepID=UPI0033B5BDD8